MEGFTAQASAKRIISLLNVGNHYRRSHGLEFAKGILVQLGADEGTVKIFVELANRDSRRTSR